MIELTCESEATALSLKITKSRENIYIYKKMVSYVIIVPCIVGTIHSVGSDSCTQYFSLFSRKIQR